MEAAPDAMVVIREDGSIFLVNGQAERTFRYSRDELIGQPIEILVPTQARVVHVELRNRYIASPKLRPMASGMSLNGRRKDGTEFPVEVSLSPVLIGGENFVASAIRDVTVQLQTKRDQSFARLLESSLNEIYVFAEYDEGFLHANEGALRNLGYSREELLGLTPGQIETQDDAAAVAERVATLRSEQESRLVFETVHQRRDGTLYPVEVHLELSEFQGRSAFVAVVQDISERRKLEQALEAMNESLQDLVEERTSQLRDAQEALVRKERLTALGQIAGGVAHEVRTPLGAIQHAAYYLRMCEDRLDDEMNEALKDIETGVRTAEGIVGELLAFGRTTQQQNSAFRAAEAVDAAIAAAMVPSAVRVLRTPPSVADSAVVFGDKGQVERILVNLIRNAVQAMGGEGELEVRAAPESGELAIYVTDSGPGIPEANLALVFEPLYTSKARGIGLGLSVARRYAELNGGTLTVQGRPGPGASFRLSLPVHEVAREVEE